MERDELCALVGLHSQYNTDQGAQFCYFESRLRKVCLYIVKMYLRAFYNEFMCSIKAA